MAKNNLVPTVTKDIKTFSTASATATDMGVFSWLWGKITNFVAERGMQTVVKSQNLLRASHLAHTADVEQVAALAAAVGYDTVEIDLLRDEPSHDMLSPDNRARVLRELHAGEYCAVLVATPCTTFSIARGNRADGAFQHGWRSARYPSGPDWLDADSRRVIDEHDALVEFSAQVLRLAVDLDLDFILENPAPRDDPDLPSFWPQRAHLLQIWDTQPLRELRASAGRAAKLLVVPQCAFGPTPSGKLFQQSIDLGATRPTLVLLWRPKR